MKYSWETVLPSPIVIWNSLDYSRKLLEPLTSSILVKENIKMLKSHFACIQRILPNLFLI